MNCLNCCVSDDLVEYTCGHSFPKSILLSKKLSILNPRCSECSLGKLGSWEDSSSEKRFGSNNEDDFDYFIGSMSSNEVSENEVSENNWYFENLYSSSSSSYSDNEDSKSEYSETDYNIYKEKCENLILLDITLFGLITIGIIVKLIVS
jgi:hypothetical protein